MFTSTPNFSSAPKATRAVPFLSFCRRFSGTHIPSENIIRLPFLRSISYMPENDSRFLCTFSGIYEILRKNGNLIMFSEGICVPEKRLQKLRKGTARVAFGAEEKFGVDVNIVPVGINYTLSLIHISEPTR